MGRLSVTHVKIHGGSGGVIYDGEIDLSRFEAQYDKAQYKLDSMVMTSMVPYMPMITGSFINLTRAKSASVAGSGYVYAAVAPYGRFLYEGKTMVDELTGSPFARQKAKKVLVSKYSGETAARENLVYTKSKHPKAQAHWFDAAKQSDSLKWLRETKKTAGGGKRG